MSDVPIQPPPLVRQMHVDRYNVDYRVDHTGKAWFSYHVYEAQDAWYHAQRIFPDHFRGTQTICVVRVNPTVIEHILESTIGSHLIPSLQERWAIERRYKLGNYVGKVLRAEMDPTEEYQISAIFTPTAYETYGTAMYEAAILALDITRTSLRHILYSITLPARLAHIEEAVDLICTQGIAPQLLQDHSSSDRELESESHQVE